MKELYKSIALLKLTDALLQLLCAVACIGIELYEKEQAVWGWLALSLLQWVSAIFWLFVLKDENHKMRGARWIRNISLVLLPCAIIIALWRNNFLSLTVVLALLSYFASALHPAYLIITCSEASFYRNLHKQKARN